MPAGVRANMQVTTAAGANEEEEGEGLDVTKIITFVPRDLQGDHKCLVMKALEMSSADPLEHLIPKLGWSDQQARFKDTDGNRKAVYKVFYKEVNSERMYVRLTDNARADVRERFGNKKVPRTPFMYKDLPNPREDVESK